MVFSPNVLIQQLWNENKQFIVGNAAIIIYHNFSYLIFI